VFALLLRRVVFLAMMFLLVEKEKLFLQTQVKSSGIYKHSCIQKVIRGRIRSDVFVLDNSPHSAGLCVGLKVRRVQRRENFGGCRRRRSGSRYSAPARC